MHDPDVPSAHPGKPKRKLQKVNTHTRDLQAKPTASDAFGASAAATAALPSAPQAAARRGKGAKASSAAPAAAKGKAAKAANAAASKGKRAHRQSSQHDEEAVLADEPIRSDTPAGNCLAYVVSCSRMQAAGFIRLHAAFVLFSC